MPRCLITGASGFVGSNLARLLRERDWDVRCLVRPQSDLALLDRLDVELVQGGLEDAESLQRAVKGVDLGLHLAGRVTALSAKQFDRVNVAGTRSLARACASRTSPPTLVYVSSLAAGGPGTPSRPRREQDAPQPVSAYGRSKLAAERAAAEFAAEVPLSIVRPPIIFGPADRASLSMYRMMKYLPVHPTPGFQGFSVSLIHVADLGDALERVALKGDRASPVGEAPHNSSCVYYVAAERDLAYGELGRLAGKAAGWSVAPAPTPKVVFWVAGAVGELIGRARRRPAIVNWDKIREATAPGWICSSEKIRTELGFKPAQSLEQRFAETVAWYREHGWL